MLKPKRASRDALERQHPAGIESSQQDAGAPRGNSKGAPTSDKEAHAGWRSRGYLPHFDSAELVQFVTFRLSDSVPTQRLEAWQADPRCTDSQVLWNVVENYLDRGWGSCHLHNPVIASLMQNALLFFDEERYRMLAWCVMPNHVHTLFEVTEGFALADVLHSWKSFTANRANAHLGTGAEFWQREYFDRFIRNENHYQRTFHYIEQNPVKAKLCARPQDWPFSSAAFASRFVSPE